MKILRFIAALAWAVSGETVKWQANVSEEYVSGGQLFKPFKNFMSLLGDGHSITVA